MLSVLKRLRCDITHLFTLIEQCYYLGRLVMQILVTHGCRLFKLCLLLN